LAGESAGAADALLALELPAPNTGKPAPGAIDAPGIETGGAKTVVPTVVAAAAAAVMVVVIGAVVVVDKKVAAGAAAVVVASKTPTQDRRLCGGRATI
jgi:hypothetical protein